MAENSSPIGGSQLISSPRGAKASALAAAGLSVGPMGTSAALALHGCYILSFIAAFLLPTLVLALVICPAIWSRKDERRRASLEVLDRLLGQQPTARPARTRRRPLGQGHTKGNH